MSYTTDAWMHAFRSNAKQCIFGNDKRSELKYLQMGGAWTRANRTVPSPDPPYVWSVSTRIKGLSQCLDFARLIKLNLHFWNLNRQVMIIKFKLSALSFKLCHLKNIVKLKKKIYSIVYEKTQTDLQAQEDML